LKIHPPRAEAPRFSARHMDRTADPWKDFYRYAVGGWQKTHPLPADRARYGAFDELFDWNLLQLRTIAARCAKQDPRRRSPEAALVGDFYRSALNTGKIEAAGFETIKDLWEVARGVNSPDDVAKAMPHLHGEGVRTGFEASSRPDDKDSAHYAFYFEQGGLALPDREYYLSKSFAKLRVQYVEHVARMLKLKGLPKGQAQRWASAVMRVETSLARASRPRELLREREMNYNRRKVVELDRKYPSLALRRYLRDAGVTAPAYVVFGQPEFFERLDLLVSRSRVEDLRAYLGWCVLNSTAPYLHAAVVKENFDFFDMKLKGQKKQQPRWRRALRVIDSSVGEALGKLYVEEHFPEEARHRVDLLIADLREVYSKKLETIPWMSAATRKRALEKFARFRVKIGHPAKFRDYSAIRIDPGDYAGNVRRAHSFEFQRQTRRVGGHVDKDEWQMTPPTVNAYYDASMNEIVFPAGILQPPFFDHMADDAVNYGGIGVVIGHEITHGYDDQGRKYDGEGNMREWWTGEDKRRFKTRAGAVVRAYDSQEILPRLHVNGRLTLGENIADLGGVNIAFEALQRRLASNTGGRKKIDGLTPEQRFFISYAQIWRQNITEMESRRLAAIDPHSPDSVRGSLPAKNHPAFASAFPPKEREKPDSRPRIGVW
jgi:putative endopeptidase